MIGEQIGPYRIDAFLGDGGMGTVFRGTDLRFDRPVAVKVLHSFFARDCQVRERFRAEAQIQARLSHPNIVHVYDFIEEGELLCLMLEYVDGRPLDKVIAEETGPIPFERCMAIMDQVLRAVGYAHDQGVVHRDLKPSNIMLSVVKGETLARVMDFGVAKILEGGKGRTATGAKMGTLWYMPPEQIRAARDVDRRSDIYSLGVTLYQMATGRVPFDADTDFSIMQAIISEEAPAPSRFYRGIFPGFEAVILKAMAKNPDARFQSAEEFLQALKALAVGAVVGTDRAAPEGKVEPRGVRSVSAGTQPPPGLAQSSRSSAGAREGTGFPLESRSRSAAIDAEAPAVEGRLQRWTNHSTLEGSSRPSASRPFPVWLLGLGLLIVVIMVVLVIRGSDGGASQRAIIQDVPRASTQSASSTPVRQVATENPVSSSHEQDRQAILGVVETWRRSLVNRDLETHMGCYADQVERYFGWTNASNARIRDDKRKALARFEEVLRYDVREVSIDFLGADHALVTFAKSWDILQANGKRYRASEKQQLWFRRFSAGWKIVSETESDVVRDP